MISLVRTTTGSVGVQYTGADKSDAGIGQISGDGVLLFGATEADEKGRVQNKYIIEQPDEDGELTLNGGAVSANIEANGYNMYLDMNSGSAAMNVEMNTVNSTYDRRFSTGSDTVVTGQASANNLIQVGSGTDLYYDQGYYNVATGSEGYKTWMTSETSDSAVILGGEKGTNIFSMNGKNGTAISRGNSSNAFYVGDNSENTLLIGGGLYNYVQDNAGRTVINDDGTTTTGTGGRTLFIGGSGTNVLEANGNNSLYDLRNSTASEVVIKGASNSYFFKSDEQEGINIYDVLMGKTGDSAITNWARTYYSGTYAAQAADSYITPALLSLFKTNATE